MFRKPSDDDYLASRTVVKAKPLPTKYAQKLSMTGKDFLSSGCEGGSAQRGNTSEPQTSTATVLTDDEKNKIHAKILKAEMKGDMDTVNKLKRRLEEGSAADNSVVLLKRNRLGDVVPARSSKNSSQQLAESSHSHMHREYGKQQNVRDMVQEEKASSAEDQLMLFHKSIIKSAKVKRYDDESLDDIAEMQKESRKRKDKDERLSMDRRRRDHERLERSLNDCVRCLESRKLAKHAVVAVGIHTYLAVAEWDGLDEQHCLIIPIEHVSSSVQLDENVWDEMRIWRKGLAALWRTNDQDCLFLEMSRNVAASPHLVIECVPVPVEVGDTAPIYFKKAIMECEEEYADNKKLIEIKDLRRQIPKGFGYFAVDFGLSNGFAHVIESTESFPSSFGHEIIAGMLDLPASKWRNRKQQEFSVLKAKCDAMKAAWEPYDWTKKIDRNRS